MIDELHSLGFKVMVWVCPLVSMDQYLICQEIMKDKGFLLKAPEPGASWDECTEPYPVTWWNGVSAVLDLSNKSAVRWFKSQLDRLMDDYGVDGFKFDAGDPIHYPADAVSKGGVTSQDQCMLYAAVGLDYPYNEYRSGWKMGGQPLVQRLGDKNHSWDDLRKLIPDMIAENLLGYLYACPDMVGGGQFAAFLDPDRMDTDLVVRSAQCHAVMPMMQFSVAPWRVLDSVRFDAVKKAVTLRQEKVAPLVMELARQAAETGEPIIRSLEYEFPHCGYSGIRDQFMLGDSFMVAPLFYEIYIICLAGLRLRSLLGRITYDAVSYAFIVSFYSPFLEQGLAFFAVEDFFSPVYPAASQSDGMCCIQQIAHDQ